MEKRKVINVLEYLGSNYTTFGDLTTKLEIWNQVLKDYNYDEVIARINDLMIRKEFSTTCPTLMTIVGPLTKSEEKMVLDGKMFECQFCRRIFNSQEDMITHEDRCRSVRYIERQYKRFSLGNIDKKDLYNMSDDVFQDKYLKLLRLIQKKTNNELEKTLIENCFNAPSPDKAKAIIGG